MLAPAETSHSGHGARAAAVGTALLAEDTRTYVGARLRLDIVGGFFGRWLCGRLSNRVGECDHRRTLPGQTSRPRLQWSTDLIEPLDAPCRSTTQQAQGEGEGHHH
ncbi:MAG: hypothetical protein GY722_12230 [bacterium]|nr:hypothetical protein [bacterium]